MLLKSLTLHNIRSYVEETVHFPAGSCLLAGDIGAGKSTILLAIEFALFGAKRGELDAKSLLRNGAHAGRIELTMHLAGKDVTISRTLKRTTTTVKQDAGYLVHQGSRHDATPTELRARMITMLGYPQEALTKKDLLYRYTVFTPQEEMRKILYDDTESRLNTLRKVFHIDKYKRVVQNAQLLAKEMRSRVRILDESVVGLAELEQKKDGLEKQSQAIDTVLIQEKPALIALQEKRRVLEEKLVLLEESKKKIEELKRQVVRCQTKITQCTSQEKQVGLRLETCKREILDLERKSTVALVPIDTVTLENELVQLRNELLEKIKIEEHIAHVEKELLHITKTLASCDTRKLATQETIQRLSSLDSCSLCLQQVGHEHKQEIIAKQESVYGLISQEAAKLLQEKKRITTQLTRAKERLVEVHTKEKEKQLIEKQLLERKHALDKRKLEQENVSLQLAEKKKHLLVFEDELRVVLLQSKQTQEELLNLEDQMKQYVDTDAQYLTCKKECTLLQNQEKEQEIRLVGFEKQREGIVLQLKHILDDIAAKKETLLEIEKLKTYSNWVSDFFVPLLSTMEKHVLLQVHAHFSSFFMTWFSMLMDDDTMSARLDEDFTPIIEQNGYETSLIDLSGGEKTAVALAYRLALNKVINDFVQGIHTRDLIILDEPTDGFSAQQLDRVRDVLAELQMQQVILVSHENKIESFVDHVLRIEKTGHVSKVLH